MPWSRGRSPGFGIRCCAISSKFSSSPRSCFTSSTSECIVMIDYRTKVGQGPKTDLSGPCHAMTIMSREGDAYVSWRATVCNNACGLREILRPYACVFSPSSRSRLTDRDLDRFPNRTLFHRVARAVCHAGCLPRKELYEAWEMARRVSRLFCGGRVVGLAAGPRLVSPAH